MEREVGGFNLRPDWLKPGASLLIGTCLILPSVPPDGPPDSIQILTITNCLQEIDYAVPLAGRVLTDLLIKRKDLFPQKRTPWYQPRDEDVPQ